jgi:hypothetical protein
MDPLENFKFFKAKVSCHINQIKARKLYVSTGTYNLISWPPTNIWIRDDYYRTLHPLSLFIEGKKVMTRQPIFHISLLLDIDINFLRAFNTGLKDTNIDRFNSLGWYQKIQDKNKKNTMKKYFVFGRLVRNKLDRKKSLERRRT